MKSPLKRAFLGLFEAVAPAPRLRLTNAVRERLVANPLTIVDVGAVFGPDKRWIQLGPRTCRFITFEPDKRSQAELSEGGPFTILALPTAIGSEAGERILHLTKGEFASSLYPPNRAVLGAFATWSWHESIGTQPVTVDTLDGVLNNHPDWRPDFIKTDIEGADLEALLGGEQAVARALGVQVEAAFIERNIGAPLFSDIDQHLRERGFTLFQLIREHWLRRNGVRGVGSRPQLIWADVVYFRDAPGFIGRLAKASDPEVLLVKFIALLLVYGHFDYATEIVALAAAKEHCSPPLADALRQSIARSVNTPGFVPRAALITLFAAVVRIAALPFGGAARERARQFYGRQAAPLFHHLYRESMRSGLERSCIPDLP